MSRDTRNLYLGLSLILFAGAAISLTHQYLAFPALLGWFIGFFINVHLDSEKAFAKYQLKSF